jgi:glycosyltransferase involved in cell wall biosynthesis
MVAPAATADDALASEITSIGIRPLPVAEASPEIYRLADCFVFPSTNETDAVEFPMSILASLSCGVPVLSTPFGGLRDFLPEGDDLRYWNTTDELVQLAQGLINGPPVRVRAVEEFSWDEIAKRIVDR